MNPQLIHGLAQLAKKREFSSFENPFPMRNGFFFGVATYFLFIFIFKMGKN